MVYSSLFWSFVNKPASQCFVLRNSVENTVVAANLSVAFHWGERQQARVRECQFWSKIKINWEITKTKLHYIQQNNGILWLLMLSFLVDLFFQMQFSYSCLSYYRHSWMVTFMNGLMVTANNKENAIASRKVISNRGKKRFTRLRYWLNAYQEVTLYLEAHAKTGKTYILIFLSFFLIQSVIWLL